MDNVRKIKIRTKNHATGIDSETLSKTYRILLGNLYFDII